jgi:hypothetical protein
MMGDKGYIGANTIDGIVAVLPHKKKRGNLSRQQKEHNKRVGRARVVAENYYGRMKKRTTEIGSTIQLSSSIVWHSPIIMSPGIHFEHRRESGTEICCVH